MDWVLWGVLFLFWVLGVAVSVSVSKSWKKRFRAVQRQLGKAADQKIEMGWKVSDLEIENHELREKIDRIIARRVRVFDPQGREVNCKVPAVNQPDKDIEVRL
ncbi:hypothetical protein [uncultured Microbulbifer sp.]|uniref:hypothetical protein n=1 Tax=uncultured Microbulbifer sp. TaxID=348147 RepID=UPI00260DCDBD|nr:hypothetical protein [uncultured Microbulbifer sp.]